MPFFVNKQCNSEHVMFPATCFTCDCGCRWRVFPSLPGRWHGCWYTADRKKSYFLAVAVMLLTTEQVSSVDKPLALHSGGRRFDPGLCRLS